MATTKPEDKTDRAQIYFFDVRDTLGEVDRPGHLVLYPSTLPMLADLRKQGFRVGVITNLPDNVSAEQGRKMLDDAGLLSEGKYVDKTAIVINHEVGVSKPDPRIYEKAAEIAGVPIQQCVFVGENLVENLVAVASGMRNTLKPCPPGREFAPPPTDPNDHRRRFEAFFEHEHELGNRIFSCGAKIVEQLKSLKEGVEIPKNVKTGMDLLVYLTNNFADQAHLKAEEAVIPLAIARGMEARHADWVLHQHEQGRAYFKGMDVAMRRINYGEPEGIEDFWRNTEGFVNLFRKHAVRENNFLYPEMAKYITDTDDSLIMNLLKDLGPADFTPYVGIVETMESVLGITSPQP